MNINFNPLKDIVSNSASNKDLIRDYITNEIQGFCRWDRSEDALGNLIARKKGNGKKLWSLLMDQIDLW